ncbi:hypothetical protein JKP88DRAFT_337336 [Tribonema minus]|uniref:Uncharacterized protein n=1 Tax=Tribonema minus TaxID=303371 RepID=A0A836C8K5_9STRA|nr:hypothetical protein JKP88DRAFT_337336 [Tribonema minus]
MFMALPASPPSFPAKWRRCELVLDRLNDRMATSIGRGAAALLSQAIAQGTAAAAGDVLAALQLELPPEVTLSSEGADVAMASGELDDGVLKMILVALAQAGLSMSEQGERDGGGGIGQQRSALIVHLCCTSKAPTPSSAQQDMQDTAATATLKASTASPPPSAQVASDHAAALRAYTAWLRGTLSERARQLLQLSDAVRTWRGAEQLPHHHHRSAKDSFEIGHRDHRMEPRHARSTGDSFGIGNADHGIELLKRSTVERGGTGGSSDSSAADDARAVAKAILKSLLAAAAGTRDARVEALQRRAVAAKEWCSVDCPSGVLCWRGDAAGRLAGEAQQLEETYLELHKSVLDLCGRIMNPEGPGVTSQSDT